MMTSDSQVDQSELILCDIAEQEKIAQEDAAFDLYMSIALRSGMRLRLAWFGPEIEKRGIKRWKELVSA
jgi:hypothetical protein